MKVNIETEIGRKCLLTIPALVKGS